MTNKEKRELLDSTEEFLWTWLSGLQKLGFPGRAVEDIRGTLYSIEIIKEMRSDYDEEENEE